MAVGLADNRGPARTAGPPTVPTSRDGGGRRVPASARPEAVDPDVDPAEVTRRARPSIDLAVVGVIAVGGVLGSEARFALGRALPHDPGSWPLATLLINLSGSFVLAALMVVLTELT